LAVFHARPQDIATMSQAPASEATLAAAEAVPNHLVPPARRVQAAPGLAATWTIPGGEEAGLDMPAPVFLPVRAEPPAIPPAALVVRSLWEEASDGRLDGPLPAAAAPCTPTLPAQDRAPASHLAHTAHPPVTPDAGASASSAPLEPPLPPLIRPTQLP